MFFDAGQTQGAIGAVVPAKSGGESQSPHLQPKQFGPKPGAPEAGAEAGAEGAAAGGAEAGAAAGGASMAELAPLLLL